MTHYLTTGQWLRAVLLWQRGRDTSDIAKAFDVPESLIYAKLPAWRAKHLGIEEVAA